MEPTYQAQALMDSDAWESLELGDAGGMDPEARDRALEICRMYQAVFDTSEQGRAVLRDLVEIYLVSTRVVQPGDDMFTAGIRQGGQDVVRRILHFIALARSGGQ